MTDAEIAAKLELLKEAYPMLAQWHCEMRMTAKYVTRAKVGEWLDRMKALNDQISTQGSER